MTADTGAGVGPPDPRNGKATGEGGDSIGTTKTTAKVSISAETVKREADKFFLLWLTTGVDYHRRLARAASDAARKP